MFPPSRIVCLTEETVETLYLIGEQQRIVGISGYVVRPPQARREKPRVSAFTSADIPKILALEPDLVLAFSDLQAEIVAELIRRGIAVHAFNQRTIAGIFDMIRMVGAMVGAAERAARLAEELAAGLAETRARSQNLPRHPNVFFEEWDEPLISGIGWVSELIEVAGGVDIFADRAGSAAARNRAGAAGVCPHRRPSHRGDGGGRDRQAVQAAQAGRQAEEGGGEEEGGPGQEGPGQEGGRQEEGGADQEGGTPA